MLTSTRFGAALLAATALLLTSWPLSAAPLLNGVAIHSELGNEKFIAGLYAETLSSEAADLLTADENKRIQVRVLADELSSRRFKRMWIEGIAINSRYKTLQKNAQNMADFSNMLNVTLIKGDILTIDRSEDGLTVSLNGTTLGTLDDRSFFDLLLRTWIGSVPLSSPFRNNLLAPGDIDSDLLARYQATRPSDKRIAAVEQAVAAQKREEGKERVAEKPELVAREAPAEIEAPDLAEPDLSQLPKLTMKPPTLGGAVPKPPKPGAHTETAEPEPAPGEEKPAEQAQLAKATPEEPKSNVFEDDEGEPAFTAASLLARQVYIGKLKSWAQKELRYPRRALRRGWEGSVRLDITLNREGDLVGTRFSEKAEHDTLNEEVLRAVEDATPFPPIPKEVRGDTFLFTLPVAFKLQEG